MFMEEVVPGLGHRIPTVQTDPRFGDNVVRVTVSGSCPSLLKINIVDGFQHIKFCSLEYDMVVEGDLQDAQSTSGAIETPVRSTSALVRAVDAVKLALNKLNYRYKYISVDILPSNNRFKLFLLSDILTSLSIFL